MSDNKIDIADDSVTKGKMMMIHNFSINKTEPPLLSHNHTTHLSTHPT
jgi:hypothetical protein